MKYKPFLRTPRFLLVTLFLTVLCRAVIATARRPGREE